MSTIHHVGPRSANTGSQSVLNNSYFIAVAVLVFIILILRIVILRRRNQPYSDFFRMSGGSRYAAYGAYPPHDSNYGSMYHGLQLAPPPSAYLRDRRVRAVATDAHGRRLDHTGENANGKDALPAYDNLDRPPKYVEAGWTHGEPSIPTVQSAVTPFSEGEQSGIAHPNITDGASADSMARTLDHTHPAVGAMPDTEPLPPPTHRDSPNS